MRGADAGEDETPLQERAQENAFVASAEDVVSDVENRVNEQKCRDRDHVHGEEQQPRNERNASRRFHLNSVLETPGCRAVYRCTNRYPQGVFSPTSAAAAFARGEEMTLPVPYQPGGQRYTLVAIAQDLTVVETRDDRAVSY